MQNIRETEEHIVVEFTNDSGKKYEVGYPKAAGYTKENIEAEIISAREKLAANASSDAAMYHTLLWIADGDSQTSRAAMKIGIVGGYVDKNSGIIYDCRMNFANNSGWSFRFIDQEDDSYVCITPRNGNHYIDYNSGHPTIEGVK
ncbi:MAG: hypothetical protein ACJ8GN_02775 [Longimicrobiaceae bacterium]